MAVFTSSSVTTNVHSLEVGDSEVQTDEPAMAHIWDSYPRSLQAQVEVGQVKWGNFSGHRAHSGNAIKFSKIGMYSHVSSTHFY
jgi:hypothetical protein